MKRIISFYMVIILSAIGLKSQASSLDPNILQKVKNATSDNAGVGNEGARRCGSRGK